MTDGQRLMPTAQQLGEGLVCGEFEFAYLGRSHEYKFWRTSGAFIDLCIKDCADDTREFFHIPARLQVKDSHPEQGKECSDIVNECLADGGVLNEVRCHKLPHTLQINF
jgi:hypothetical protein